MPNTEIKEICKTTIQILIISILITCCIILGIKLMWGKKNRYSINVSKQSSNNNK